MHNSGQLGLRLCEILFQFKLTLIDCMFYVWGCILKYWLLRPRYGGMNSASLYNNMVISHIEMDVHEKYSMNLIYEMIC
jgi:hypothetical protein